MQTKNLIHVFNNDEFGRLEVLEINGKPYFPATEIAKLLGYRNPYKAINDHCPHLTKREVGVQTGEKADGSPAMQVIEKSFIPEGDLYRLIIRSKLPAARRFESWVCDTVLVSIRQHGIYITEELLRKIEADKTYIEKLIKDISANETYIGELIHDLSAEKDRNSSLHGYAVSAAPKVQYYDIVLQNTNAVPVSIIAKEYGLTAADFNRLLHKRGIQYKIRKTWLLYAAHANMGYTIPITYCFDGINAEIHTCWTLKGRKWLYDKLKMFGIVPISERMGGTSSNSYETDKAANGYKSEDYEQSDIYSIENHDISIENHST